jgi:hypothetical protein
MNDDTKFPSELAERFQIRMPDGLRDRIRAAAENNARSMNSEIVARLEASFTVDMESPEARDEMSRRLHALMDEVTEEMREESRITRGMPLLLKWFDQHPEERQTFDNLPVRGQEEFARSKSHQLWLEHIQQFRDRPAGRTASTKQRTALGPTPSGVSASKPRGKK